MNNLNKVLVLICLYLVFMLAEACHGSNCSCPEVTLPYFVIGTYELESPDKEITEFERLSLELTMSDLTYVAQAQPCTPKVNWFYTSMYGCSCVSDGYMGMKDELIAIDVFSTKDFDENHLAGTLLNDLVIVDQYGNQNLKQIIQNGNMRWLISQYNLEDMGFTFEKNPEVLGEHDIKMEIHFKSGEFEVVEVPGVNFL